jgi:hypothetical protein
VRAQSPSEARPTLTLERPAPAPRDTGDGPTSGGANEGAPGLRSAFARTRAAIRSLVAAHVELLKAELQVAMREVAIIAGLLAAALVLAILLLLLLWVGTWLFLGEWLFG